MFASSFLNKIVKAQRAIFYGAFVLLLMSCSSNKLTDDVQQRYNQSSSSHFPNAGGTDALQEGRARTQALNGPIAVIGTGKFIEITEANDLEALDASNLGGNPNDAVALNFTNVPVEEAARAILGEILNLNYAIDPDIKGTINFKTSKPVMRSKLVGIFQDLLSRQQLIISEQEDVFHITTIQNALKSGATLPPGTKQIDKATVSPIQLEFVSASQLVTVLSPVVSEYATLRADNERNILMVKSDLEHLGAVYELIQIFDVDWMAGLSFAMYPLAQTTPANMIKDLQGIFKNDKNGVLANLIDFIPVDRLNSVLVVTKNPQYLMKIARWIEQLDRGEEGSMGLYVYKLNHTKADTVSEVLGNIFGADMPAQTAATAAEPKDSKSDNADDKTDTKASVDPQSTQRSIQAGNINIYPDVRNNSVVVRAAPAEYKMVEVALKKLDVPPLQVMIEATISQVTLGDNFELGLSWFFGKKGTTGKVGFAGDAKPNLFSYILNKNNLNVTLSALQSMTDVKVISSPHVMVLNNESASLNSGTEIPITKQITTNIDANNSTPVSTDIEYRKLGVTLDVTPHITGSGVVNLKIKQSTNEVTSASTAINANTPTISNQSVETMVSLRSGETVALGGLISDSDTKGKDGVPFLRDIPLVGNLFSKQSNAKTRSELLILLTPHIVESTQQADMITNELKYKMAAATKFSQDVNEFYPNGGRLKVGFVDGPQPNHNPANFVKPTNSIPEAQTASAPAMADPTPAKTTAPIDLISIPKAAPKPKPIAAKLSAPSITSGNGSDYVQLTAMKDNFSALKEWRLMKAKYPDTLGKLSPVINEYQTASGNSYFRVQAGPIAQADAIKLCDYLKGNNQPCLVVK